MINTTIAHYKITAKLGQGGMGAVYRATDTKLDREVAIKVLPESFAQDKERLARFDREAKALASLNHPNIASIFGIEQSGDSQALILELVEGEDLSTRIKRGPMPVEEALEVCKQIAEALEAAHEKGIIHRDLKPANVKLTEDGKVKVLDFGLAKAMATESSATSTTDSMSPTITADYTMPGVIMGTAAYMSPEQARGKPVDKRSDIWSFGVVLFECLTGQRIYSGETVTDTIGALLHKEPDWTALPENTPPTIHLLLRKCLAKDRKRRLHDIADARVDLEQAITDPSSSFIRLSEGALQETKGGNGIQRQLVAGLVLVAVVVTAAIVWFLKPLPEPTPTIVTDHPPAPIRRLEVNLGVEGNLQLAYGTAARLSPDGSTLAYIYFPEGGLSRSKLFIRRLDQLEPTELTAAENANQFCFSPDGQSIAFRKDTEKSIMKASVTGGPAIRLCETGATRGLDWSEDGWIVFARSPRSGLFRVPDTGGTPEPLTTLSEEEVTHRWPQFIPGQEAVLYTAHSDGSGFDDANIMVQRLSGGEPKLLWRGGYHARLLPSGHLVFMQQGTLFAAAFDLDSLTLLGQPSPVLEEVVANWRGGAHFDISSDGSLVYATGSLRESLHELQWLDRKGVRVPLLPPGKYRSFKLSPDGQFLAYSLDDGVQDDIWIYDIERGIPSKLTFDPADDGHPIWSPSGQSIVFGSERDGTSALYWKRIDDGPGESQRLTVSENLQLPWSWHPDGLHLAILEVTPENSTDLRVVNLSGDDRSGWKAGETTNFLATRFGELNASISPDGLWLAHSSNESGQNQVLVRSFPGGDGRKQISIEGIGSRRPMWSATQQELIFVTDEGMGDGTQQIFTAKYRVNEGVFIPETPIRWEGGIIPARQYNTMFDVHPDGERLLVRTVVDADETEQSFDHVVLFENFTEYLEKTIPSSTNQSP